MKNDIVNINGFQVESKQLEFLSEVQCIHEGETGIDTEIRNLQETLKFFVDKGVYWSESDHESKEMLLHIGRISNVIDILKYINLPKELRVK
jgi:hypothetical protein